jgi:hypothetical protein
MKRVGTSEHALNEIACLQAVSAKREKSLTMMHRLLRVPAQEALYRGRRNFVPLKPLSMNSRIPAFSAPEWKANR